MYHLYPFKSGLFVVQNVVCTDGCSLRAEENRILCSQRAQSCPLQPMALLTSALSLLTNFLSAGEALKSWLQLWALSASPRGSVSFASWLGTVTTHMCVLLAS